ncbi:MAG: hypothetical protein HKN78_13065 [Sphingomonadaceae bacterium]|nr:hypothetical protein [Sphingomonadaceae bacterium]
MPTPHPLEEIDDDRCYQWYLDQSATLSAGRAARQDGLIATITQISSAAVLAVPGFVVASESGLPSFWANEILYFGITGFGGALLAAMAEQHYSAKAHQKQIEILEKFYFKESSETEDIASRNKVKWARRTSYLLFLLALTLTAVGLIRI